jgi:FkbM family methyltransferase
MAITLRVQAETENPVSLSASDLARRALPERFLQQLRGIRRDLTDRIRYGREQRAAWYQRMTAGQHLDFEEVERLVTPADGAMIDVGAERGEVARFFLRKGFDVLAVEPENTNFKRLRRIRSSRLRTVQAACSDKSGSGFLDVKPGTYYHRIAEDGSQPIRITTLVDLFAEHNISSVSVLKIDVEGHEPTVLRGLFAGSIAPTVIIAEFSRETLPELLDTIGDRYPFLRFMCRWNEEEGLRFQIRSAMFDGRHPLALEATWGNLICSTRSFRELHPLSS